MIESSVAATSVAHAIHYAVLGAGALGLLALLGPQLFGGRSAPLVDDEHALRVWTLNEQISSGGLGIQLTPALPATAARSEVPEVVDDVCALYLPIAVVSSTAAAGIHAAVGPAHFRELVAFGVFFAACALAQVGWSLIMAVRPSRTLLLVAVVCNSAVLVLWLVTRTIGLPGLLPRPEEVGLLDACTGVWESAVVLAAARLLNAGPGINLRLPAWPDWRPSARAWTLGSALLLAVLTVVEVGA